ncbi:hypothetical protein GUJ93_ZPchr0009g517 [Zizania palustris]|uniref:HTH La-type RNA-binding domain-containing protein n=1 Tax=Zizania palustris TaxID=103762 RepID=A0A8J5VKF8_ZIZPA|nr:hypothetical protein GUJ93_ZPchr0009g517 [Zizania palustris]
MSPAAGGAAPTQPAVSAAVSPPAVAAPGPDHAPPPPQANRRDPQGPSEVADPGNAAARKTAWNVPAPPPAAPALGGIMGGAGSWPALAESARAWPKSASSDSLKSLSDGFAALSTSDDLMVPSLPPHPVANPISAGSNPTSASPPPNATAAATLQQNINTDKTNPVRHGGGTGGNNRGSSGGIASSDGSNSSHDGNAGDGSGGNWNNGGFGSGSGSNSSYGHSNINIGAVGSNMNNNVHSTGTSSSGHDSSRRAIGNSSWNNNGRSGGNNNSGTGSGDGSNRNSGGSGSGGGNLWNNNGRNGSSSTNGFGGRGGNHNRRDHDRGGNFSPRNYSRHSPMQHQQQHSGIYQPGSFPRQPPPPPPPAHFMVPQPFVPYVPPFAYPADVQPYPFYLPPMEQFQNMHLVRLPMQPVWFNQDQQNIQDVIRMQIEFYFSTNNLCHDTYLRRQMNDQGWVPIDVITHFNRVSFFLFVISVLY